MDVFIVIISWAFYEIFNSYTRRLSWLPLTCIALNICLPITSTDGCAPESPCRTRVLVWCSCSALVIFLTVSRVSVETIGISAGDSSPWRTIRCKWSNIMKWCGKGKTQVGARKTKWYDDDNDNDELLWEVDMLIIGH